MSIIQRGGQWMKLYPDGLVFKPMCAREAQEFDVITAKVIAGMTGGNEFPNDTECKCCQCLSNGGKLMMVNLDNHFLCAVAESGLVFNECRNDSFNPPCMFDEQQAWNIVSVFPKLRAVKTSYKCPCGACCKARYNKTTKPAQPKEEPKAFPSWYGDDALADRKGLEIAREWGIKVAIEDGYQVIRINNVMMSPRGFARRIYRSV